MVESAKLNLIIQGVQSKNILRCIGVIVIITVFIACTNENGSKEVKETINQDYLESESYQSFTKRSRVERRHSIKQEQNFTEFVRQRLTKFEAEKLTLPAVINEEMMKSSYRREPAARSSLITLFGFQQIYDPLAKIDASNMQYYLFMTCKVTSYKKCLVWFASGKKGRLIQLEMLTTYMQSPTYSEVPVINITKARISIEVNRSVLYALGSVDKYILRYKLTKDGKIFRVPNH